MTPGMAAAPVAGKEESARHPWGPRSIGALLPAVTRTAFRKRAPAAASLMADWAAIVGPALAATTFPRRLSAGTLTLGCAGPVALELQHLAGPLIERINMHLGQALVLRLRFVQEVVPRSGTGAVVRRQRVPLDPVAIDGLPEGGLRDALAALGAEILADRA